MATGSYSEIKAWQSDLDSLEKLNNMFLDVLDELAERKGDESSRSQEKKSTAEAVKSTKRNEFNITINDVRILQSIPRKSINEFTSEELNIVEKWARKFYKELGEKSPFFRAWFGDWRKNDKTSIKIANIPEYIATNEARRKMRGKVVCFDTQVDNGDQDNKTSGWEINISREGETNTISHSGDAGLSEKALSGIRELIENAVLLDTEIHEHHSNNANNDNICFDHKLYALGVGLDGRIGLYKITVEEYFQSKTEPANKRFHNLRYIEKIADNIGGRTFGNDRSGGSTNDTSTIDYTVSDLFSFVKKYDSEFKPNPASKVVNPDGTPRVMYHGTTSSFTAFDKKKAKSSGLYGRGFYFTESESHAGQYGNAMAVYLDIKNPLEPGKNKVSKEQLRKFLEAVAENEDYDIWNYGTEDISEIVESIYKNDAFAVIQDVNATAIGNFAEALELFNNVNDTNFDGIITPTETVVYEPTQIKSAADNIGTFDKSNPDIRYSTKRDTDRKQSQLDIINAVNPALNSYNTWIRSIEDIKTLAETLEDSDWDYDEFNPDLTRADIKKAIRNGEITVYSSKPIESGVFVTPSRMEAESYSADSKVYEKVVSIDDVAWIDPTQGMFAEINDSQGDFRYSRKRTVASRKKKSYNKHTVYNQFNSVALNWSRQADRNIGDLAIFAYNYDDFRLIEATEDGYIELARGNYKNVRSIYERAYRNSTDTLYGHLEEFRSEKRRNIRNLQPYENRGYDDRGGGQVGSEELQHDSSRSDEYSRLGDKEESVNHSTKRESSIPEDASDYILDTKEYREILEIADERFELAGRKELSPKAIDRLAGNLLKKSKSNYSRELLTERLTALFDYIANSRDVSQKAEYIKHILYNTINISIFHPKILTPQPFCDIIYLDNKQICLFMQ